MTSTPSGEVVDLLAALQKSVAAAKSARADALAKEAVAAATPRPKPTLLPKTDGDVAYAVAMTTRMCQWCDHAIFAGSAIVTHHPAAAWSGSHPYHADCWEARP